MVSRHLIAIDFAGMVEVEAETLEEALEKVRAQHREPKDCDYVHQGGTPRPPTDDEKEWHHE